MNRRDVLQRVRAEVVRVGSEIEEWGAVIRRYVLPISLIVVGLGINVVLLAMHFAVDGMFLEEYEQQFRDAYGISIRTGNWIGIGGVALFAIGVVLAIVRLARSLRLRRRRDPIAT